MPTGIFLPLEVDFADDEAVARLARYTTPGHARACRDLLVQMWLYCKRKMTDGHVPAEIVGRLVYPDPPRVGKRDADRLVDCGIAERTETGYYLPGYLKRNPTRAEVETKSQAKRQNGRKGGQVSGQVRRGEANSKHGANHGANHGAKHALDVGLNTETESETESEPQTKTSSGYEREQRTEPSSPADERCTSHQGIDDPGPCRGCMIARQAAEQRAEAARTAQLRRRLDCRHCDENGMVLDADSRPVRRCTHPHLAPVRNTA